MTDKPNPDELPISRDAAQQYRALRLAALRRIRAYDLSEAAFQFMFDRGLLPLEDFMRRAARELGQPLTDKVETAFAHAARAVVFDRPARTAPHATIGDLLSFAQQRHEKLRDDIFARLEKGGAQIQPVHGCLVLTDPVEKALAQGEGGAEYKPEFAPRTREVVFALLRMGIFADDLFIYRGTVLPNMMRQAPYALIDIPRLGKQIAVCDQIGEICFVADEAKPLSFWSSSSKNVLKADPAIHTARYDRDGKWLDKICDLLLGDGITTVSANRFPKVAVPRATKKSILTKEALCRWIIIFKEIEGRYPTKEDKKLVWDHEADGKHFIVAGETWNAIHMAFVKKSRRVAGMDYDSLTDFKRQNGFDSVLTSEQLCRWLTIFKEIYGRYPVANDKKPVWDRDDDGKLFIVADKTWKAIDATFVRKSRRVAGMDYASLADFRRLNGFDTRLTQDRLCRWIAIFKEIEHRYPSADDKKTVYDRDAEGKLFIVSGETWSAIDHAFADKSRRVVGMNYDSLADFKRQNGFIDQTRSSLKPRAAQSPTPSSGDPQPS